MGGCHCSAGGGQVEEQTIDAAKGKELPMLPVDELLVPEPEEQKPEVELGPAKGAPEVLPEATKGGDSQVLAPLLEVAPLSSQAVGICESKLSVAGQDSHLPVAGYQSTFAPGSTITGQQSSMNPAYPTVTGTSCIQHDCLQALLATRLVQKPGKTLRIQDVSPTFEDRQAKASVRRPSILGMNLDRYSEKHHEAFAELLELDARPWTFKKKQDDVDIFTYYDTRRQGTCFKGVAEMRLEGGGLFYILENLLDAGKRPEWDELCMHGEILEQYLPYYRVSYFRFQSPARGIITNRDVLLIGRFRFEGDGTLLVALSSTTHPERPETPEFVRLKMLCGGYIIRTTSDKTLFNVTFLGSVDPMGWVPEFVKNLVAWKQAQVLAKFKSRNKV